MKCFIVFLQIIWRDLGGRESFKSFPYGHSPLLLFTVDIITLVSFKIFFGEL